MNKEGVFVKIDDRMAVFWVEANNFRVKCLLFLGTKKTTVQEVNRIACCERDSSGLLK